MLNSFVSKKSTKETVNAYQFALHYAELVHEEVEAGARLYGKEAGHRLKQYYTNSRRSRAAFEFYSHYYAERVKHLIVRVSQGMKILDAGCGLGSESILCGILGAKVTGVDISDRINQSPERVKYFEKKLGKKIEVQFCKQSIFKHHRDYDLIWVNEAISHIDPVDKFLRHIHRNLKPGGLLLIADANKLNPLLLLSSKKEQQKYGGIIIHEKDPQTQETITYAIERIFTTFSIKNLVSRIFTVTKLDIFGFFPFFLFTRLKSLCPFLEDKIIRHLPLFKYLGGAYVIQCQKKGK